MPVEASGSPFFFLFILYALIGFPQNVRDDVPLKEAMVFEEKLGSLCKGGGYQVFCGVIRGVYCLFSL